MSEPLFALIDCNNFFVSCERLFRPDLENKPVVVLSSNDGCAVSRSAEAKALGIPMGAPAFKYRDLFDRHGVTKFSANFELYGNVSRRIIALLASITPNIEIYSIDESFLDISSLPITDYEQWGGEIRQRIMDWVGIPVSIGIAPTKTLAKLANVKAKTIPETHGVVSMIRDSMLDTDKTEYYLRDTSIDQVWGIGWRLTPKMRGQGIFTAYDLAQMRPTQAQQLIGIHGKQIIAELNGTSCHPLVSIGSAPKSIASTRTFGEDTSDRNVIVAAISTFVTEASFKLRRSGQLAADLSLFATTDRHKPGYQTWTEHTKLLQPTADTGLLIHHAVNLFDRFYSDQVRYHRAGITLHGFLPDDQLQTDLLGSVDVAQHVRSLNRMRAIDEINNQHGKRTIRPASEMLADNWRPRRNICSPRYVSSWTELPKVSSHKQN